MARILAALSGGVDSAIAAARLVAAGHDVTAVHCRLADVPLAAQVPGQGCCTLDDAQDARRTAQVLGIPFYVWDLGAVFEREVRQPFVAAYAEGVTPNPCVTCNERVKVRALLDRARRLGFDGLATGHHARIVRGAEGQPRLLRAADPAKDQSYVLYVCTADELAHLHLPTGETTKAQVRAEAAALGLRVAAKPDSYEVCFIPQGDTRAYLAQRLPAQPGEIVTLDGDVLGTHDGVWGFTIGQRRGLGLDHHERLFVVELDAARNRVIVGPRAALAVRWIEVDTWSWTSGSPPEGELRVQVRAHGATVPGRVEGSRVHLDQPLYGVARGQAVVVYDAADRVCLGGGRCAAAERPVPAGALHGRVTPRR